MSALKASNPTVKELPNCIEQEFLLKILRNVYFHLSLIGSEQHLPSDLSAGSRMSIGWLVILGESDRSTIVMNILRRVIGKIIGETRPYDALPLL